MEPTSSTTVSDPAIQFPPTFDFHTERKPIDTLISDWEEEKTKVKNRRELRENKKNVQEEQQKKVILKDETIIPDRTINTNIHRGRVPFINYITQSQRLLIIENVDNPEENTESLELWFTRGMRYPKWKIPWFKLVDSIHTHGGSAVEVIYDDNAPFNCSIEFIPRDSLIFNKKTRDIQASPRLLRLYEISILQFEEFSNQYGFDPAAAKEVTDKYKSKDELICIYKVFFKRQNVVYNAWYSKDCTTNWLRKPVPHDIGIKDFDKAVVTNLIQTGMWEKMRQQFDIPATLHAYPVFWFPYDLTEDEELLATQGRVALDLHEQEALTHLMTNTVNATTRASNFYPTAEGQPGDDSKLEELGPLKHGVVMSGKINVFQAPWPNNIITSVVQVLDQRKANQTGNVDFAALARKDANKTATEMNLATQQSQSLNVTEIDIFSSPFLDVMALCFTIATHQAIFLLCKPPPHFEQLFGDYHLSPAGDVEVIKRAEDRENAKEFFNIVKGTPLAEKLFQFLIEHFFPDEADEWIKVMNSPDKDSIIKQLLSILQAIPIDELSPEQRTALRAIIISTQNVVGESSDNPVSGNVNQSQEPPITTSNATVQANAS